MQTGREPMVKTRPLRLDEDGDNMLCLLHFPGLFKAASGIP